MLMNGSKSNSNLQQFFERLRDENLGISENHDSPDPKSKCYASA